MVMHCVQWHSPQYQSYWHSPAQCLSAAVAFDGAILADESSAVRLLAFDQLGHVVHAATVGADVPFRYAVPFSIPPTHCGERSPDSGPPALGGLASSATHLGIAGHSNCRHGHPSPRFVGHCMPLLRSGNPLTMLDRQMPPPPQIGHPRAESLIMETGMLHETTSACECATAHRTPERCGGYLHDPPPDSENRILRRDTTTADLRLHCHTSLSPLSDDSVNDTVKTVQGQADRRFYGSATGVV